MASLSSEISVLVQQVATDVAHPAGNQARHRTQRQAVASLGQVTIDDAFGLGHGLGDSLQDEINPRHLLRRPGTQISTTQRGIEERGIDDLQVLGGGDLSQLLCTRTFGEVDESDVVHGQLTSFSANEQCSTTRFGSLSSASTWASLNSESAMPWPSRVKRWPQRRKLSGTERTNSASTSSSPAAPLALAIGCRAASGDGAASPLCWPSWAS
ncbi:hypothetical protein PSA77_05672 [Pseudomonas aeruginosa]|nr:hypothetical protein PSA77_05672 [Pseudomonas aeruginosa]